MTKQDIVIARCPNTLSPESIHKFAEIVQERLANYIVFIDADSDRFDIELVTKPIVIRSPEDLDEQLEKLNSLIKEIRDGDLKQL